MKPLSRAVAPVLNLPVPEWVVQELKQYSPGNDRCVPGLVEALRTRMEVEGRAQEESLQLLRVASLLLTSMAEEESLQLKAGLLRVASLKD